MAVSQHLEAVCVPGDYPGVGEVGETRRNTGGSGGIARKTDVVDEEFGLVDHIEA